MKKHLILLSLLLPFLSCSEKPSGNVESFWDDLDVVAEKIVVDGDSAILCDYNKVKGQERKTIPFAELFEDYEVVKLDNEDERALLSSQGTAVALSENYIGIYLYEQFPFKLFRRSDGKYLRDIGGFGQGPGEYGSILQAQIDEEHNCIYVMPNVMNVIFVYDLEGNYLRKIQLPDICFGFAVDVENQRLLAATGIGVRHTPFLWELDLNGNVLQELVSSEKYDLRGARLLCGSMNAGAFDIFINYRHVSFYGNTEVDENSIYANRYDRTNPQNTVDFLCHYLPEENRLSAQFGIKNLDEIYAIYEFSNQFVVETLMSTYGVSEDDLKSETIIVDKKTGKGCRFDGIRMPSGLLLKMYTSMRFYRDGYLLANVFGSELDRQIEKLDRSTLTSSEQKELERLESMIHDSKEDCNIIFIAKMK